MKLGFTHKHSHHNARHVGVPILLCTILHEHGNDIDFNEHYLTITFPNSSPAYHGRILVLALALASPTLLPPPTWYSNLFDSMEPHLDIEKDPFGYYGPGALRARKTTRIGESVVRLFQTVLMDASSYTTLSHSPASRCAHCSLLSLTCSRIHPCGQPMPYAMSTLTQRSCAWKARRSVQLKMRKIASGGVFAWDMTDMMAGDCRSAKDGAHADSSCLLLLL
jgi:hypothetical protein